MIIYAMITLKKLCMSVIRIDVYSVVYMHLDMCIFFYIYIYMYVFTYIYMYVYIFIHVYTICKDIYL